MPRLQCNHILYRLKRQGNVTNFKNVLHRNNSNDSSPSDSYSFFLRNPLQWYIIKLDTYPLSTKCISSGIIAGSGDLVCQSFNNDEKTNHLYDWKRTLRFTILGFFLVAPTVHVWYGFLMTKIPGTSVSAIMKRLFYDQGIFTPLFLPTFLCSLTVLEHLSLNNLESNKINYHHPNVHDFTSRLQMRMDSVPDAIVVGWNIWIPSMAVIFAVVPSKFHVLFSNCVGFVWNAYLSWKTHSGEEKSIINETSDGNS